MGCASSTTNSTGGNQSLSSSARGSAPLPLPANSELSSSGYATLGAALTETMNQDFGQEVTKDPLAGSIRCLLQLRKRVGSVCFPNVYPQQLTKRGLPDTVEGLVRCALHTQTSSTVVPAGGGPQQHPLGTLDDVAFHMKVDKNELQTALHNVFEAMEVIYLVLLQGTPLETYSAAGDPSNVPMSNQTKGVLKGVCGSFASRTNMQQASTWDRLLGEVDKIVKGSGGTPPPTPTQNPLSAPPSTSFSDKNPSATSAASHDIILNSGWVAALEKYLPEGGVSTARSVGLFAILRLCAETAITVATIALGGRSCIQSSASLIQDPEINVTFTTVSKCIRGFFDYGCAHPNKGMESPALVEEHAEQLRAILFLLGVMPAAPEGEQLVDWGPSLPHQLLLPQASSTLLYLSALTTSQQKVSFKGLHRPTLPAEVLEQLRSRLKHQPGMQPSTYRVFPSFAIGQSNVLEPGEGHGPRKEFFDLCGRATFEEFGEEIVLDSTFVAIVEEGVAKITLSFSTDDEMIISKVKALLVGGNAVEVLHSDPEMESFMSIVSGVTAVDDVAYILRVTSNPTWSTEAGTVILRVKQQPPFTTFGRNMWFNEVLDDGASNLRDISHHLHDGNSKLAQAVTDTYGFVGFIIGTAVVNGVTLPVQLPELLFKYILADVCSTSYIPTAKDLCELDESYVEVLDGIRKLSHAELVEVIKTDLSGSFDPKTGFDPTTVASKGHEHYIQKYMVEALLHEGCKNRLAALLDGFRASGLASLSITRCMSATTLRNVVCGRSDNAAVEFDIFHEFIIAFDDDWQTSRVRSAFKSIVADAMNHNDPPEYKRALLQFVTGRSMLPAVPSSEVIRVHLVTGHPEDLMDRLPAAHTCDNAFEIPDYLRAVLRAEVANNDDADAPDEEIWMLATAEQRAHVREVARVHLRRKLLVAVMNSTTYELDELEPLEERPITHKANSKALDSHEASLCAPREDTPPHQLHALESSSGTHQAAVSAALQEGSSDYDEEDYAAPVESQAALRGGIGSTSPLSNPRTPSALGSSMNAGGGPVVTKKSSILLNSSLNHSGIPTLRRSSSGTDIVDELAKSPNHFTTPRQQKGRPPKPSSVSPVRCRQSNSPRSRGSSSSTPSGSTPSSVSSTSTSMSSDDDTDGASSDSNQNNQGSGGEGLPTMY